MIGVVSAGLRTTVLPAAIAGAEFPDRHHQRVVPWGHLPDHADRLAAGERRVALHVLARRPALQAARGAGEETQVVGHHRHLIVLDRLDRLARVQCLAARDLLAVLLEHSAMPSSACARWAGVVRPALKGAREPRAQRGRPPGRLRSVRAPSPAGGGIEHRFGLAPKTATHSPSMKLLRISVVLAIWTSPPRRCRGQMPGWSSRAQLGRLGSPAVGSSSACGDRRVSYLARRDV